MNDAVDELTRWVDGGGTWQLVSRHNDILTVALYTCDGGEEMHRIKSCEPAFSEWVDQNIT